LWSKEKQSVILEKMQIDETYDDKYGELCIYFNPHSWNTSTDGLIYTDKKFMSEFHIILQKLGFSKEESDNVDYSE